MTLKGIAVEQGGGIRLFHCTAFTRRLFLVKVLKVFSISVDTPGNETWRL